MLWFAIDKNIHRHNDTKGLYSVFLTQSVPTLGETTNEGAAGYFCEPYTLGTIILR